jgi:hypothetical protein
MFGYIVFFTFIVTLLGIFGTTGVATAFGDSVSTPACEVGGWDALVDIAVCAYNYFTFFFSLMSVSSTYLLVGVLLVTPMVIMILWFLAEWLRGV